MNVPPKFLLPHFILEKLSPKDSWAVKHYRGDGLLTGQLELAVPHFITHCFIVLRRFVILFCFCFYKLRVCDKQVYRYHVSNSIGSFWVSVSFWYNSLKYFKRFHYYCICYGDLSSVTFDVTIVTAVRCHEPCETEDLTDNDACFDSSTAGHSSSLPLLPESQQCGN